MQSKASTTTTKFPEKMAAIAPLAIGTRGTVGSLVRKEMEFFSKFELAASQKPQPQVVGMTPRSGHSRPSFWFLIMTWKRKKHKGSRFLPSVCSAVEVAESNQLNRIPGFNYRLLKNDVK